MSQDEKWENVVESLRNANVPLRLAQGIVEILDKAGYPLEEAIDIDKILTRLCRRYDTQTADPSHSHRVAAYTYARLAVLQQSRPQSTALLLTQTQRVQ
jgi:hypothetical protein